MKIPIHTLLCRLALAMFACFVSTVGAQTRPIISQELYHDTQRLYKNMAPRKGQPLALFRRLNVRGHCTDRYKAPLRRFLTLRNRTLPRPW